MGKLELKIWYLVFVLSCLLLSLPAHAQNYDNPGLGDLPVVTHPQDYKPLGVRAGGFMLHPGVQLAAQYTDNVFFTEAGVQSDTIYHIRPYVTAQSNWSSHSLNVRLAADIARHRDYGFRDYEDYFLLINGQLDVLSRSYLSYSLEYMDLHEGLNSRDSEQGFEPTRYSLYGASLGYDHSFNRLSIGLGVVWRRLDFDNAYGFDGNVIDNQDRDRDQGGASFRMGYQFQTDKQVFFSVSHNQVDYREPIDRNGFHRNSSGYNFNTGVAFTVTSVLNGDIFVSYHDQQYDDPSLPNVDGWAGGAGLAWNPTRLTSIGFRISSSIEATTYQYSSGYFRTLYTLRADHELRRDLQISAQISYSDNDYQLTADAPEDARSNDQSWTVGLGLSYFINRNMFLNASYNYNKTTSNLPGDGWAVNQVWLVLALEY